MVKMVDGEFVTINNALRFHSNNDSRHWTVDVLADDGETSHLYFNKDFVQYIGEEVLIQRKATK